MTTSFNQIASKCPLKLNPTEPFHCAYCLNMLSCVDTRTDVEKLTEQYESEIRDVFTERLEKLLRKIERLPSPKIPTDKELKELSLAPIKVSKKPLLLSYKPKLPKPKISLEEVKLLYNWLNNEYSMNLYEVKVYDYITYFSYHKIAYSPNLTQKLIENINGLQVNETASLRSKTTTKELLLTLYIEGNTLEEAFHKAKQEVKNLLFFYGSIAVQKLTKNLNQKRIEKNLKDKERNKKNRKEKRKEKFNSELPNNIELKIKTKKPTNI